MKHETFNSMLAAVGLVVASVTAWYQFAPSSDQLAVVSEGRIEVGRNIEVDDPGGEIEPVLGPIFWKIRVHNSTDSVVSIVDFEVYLLTPDNRKTYYSSMKESLFGVNAELTDQPLPINIGARETNAFLVSLFVPFKRGAGKSEICGKDRVTLRVLESCFFLDGRDIFGNSVDTLYGDSKRPDIVMATWTDQMKMPIFVLEFETADGSKFSENLTYYPFW
jgi:hypothetical protein